MLEDFSVKELPGLPFRPDVASAKAWLDKLPVGNTVECCRLIYETIFALRVLPLEARLLFELLETCRPAVYGTVYAMTGLYVNKPFPLEPVARKLAVYSYRFHMESALGYLGIVRQGNFIALFDREQRAAVVARAFEHLAHALLKISLIYEPPPKEVWGLATELYVHSCKDCLLDDGVEPVTPRAMFQRMLLFVLAAPGRLDQAALQSLFDRLATLPGDDRARMRFLFEAARPTIATPAWTGLADPPLPDFVQAGPLAGGMDSTVPPLEAALAPVPPRLGQGLECPEDMEGLPTELYFGFKPVAMTLRFLETRRFQSAGTDYWPRLHRLDFKPLDEIDREAEGGWRPFRPSPLGAIPDKRTVDILPTDRPDYCLADSGQWPLRAGLLVGMDLGEWIRLGTVRGGLMRGGRFWHSIEMLGTFPRLVNVFGNHPQDGPRTGFLLDDRDNQGGLSLIVPPVRWSRGDPVRVDMFREKYRFRIGRLFELTADYCQFELFEDAGPDLA